MLHLFQLWTYFHLETLFTLLRKTSELFREEQLNHDFHFCLVLSKFWLLFQLGVFSQFNLNPNKIILKAKHFLRALEKGENLNLFWNC